MTEQEIIDNNRIIAEFMGAKSCKQHPNTQLFLTIKDNKNPSLQYWHLLKYHKSYDWLIPVIRKIYVTKGYIQYIRANNIFEDGIDVNVLDILISYKKILDFIKWYNKNIKQ